MSKIGVGIGDDFPVDDEGNGSNAGGPQGAPRSEQEEFEDWKRRRDAHRAEREQWRASREEWRAKKRTFKQKVREAARESFGGDYDRWRHERYGRDGHRHGWYPALWLLVPILALALFISLISAIFKAPFLFLGLIAIAAVLFNQRRWLWHGDWHDYSHGHGRGYGRGYGRDDHGPNRGGPIVTPPPSQTPPAPPAVTNGN
ncbi:MAG TPA: hypothetical protein VGG48_08795 [Rhizomicrobium sp.]|jgi:hypothetical protein